MFDLARSRLRAPAALDNCVLSDGFAVMDYRHGADIGSDHFPLVVDSLG